MNDGIFYLAGKIPVMLMGAPGTGKTAAVTKFAADYFPAVYRWIAEQSPECEHIFAKYAMELLAENLVSDKECMAVLGLERRKNGRVNDLSLA